MRIWLENVYSKNVVHETRRQIHKNMDLSTKRLFYINLLNIETSPLICSANRWTGFYMISASVMKGLSC